MGAKGVIALKEKSDALRLENQLSFPLYAAARKMVAAYTPYLKEINLTYTQFIVMAVLWQEGEISVRDLCRTLYLDSGTLTPLLKRLETMGYLTRERSEEDERSVIVTITEKGRKLRKKAKSIPGELADELSDADGYPSKKEIEKLKKQLYALLDALV